MKLFVATHNAHKVREMSQIMPGVDIVPDDPADIEENAPDFEGNALIKVRAIAARHPGESRKRRTQVRAGRALPRTFT